jgi:cystathionine beta-lyase
MAKPRKPALPTSLIHHPYQPPAGFAAPQPGVHKASTVIFADTAAMHARTWKEKTGYTYGLHGTPTTFTLEERIATLEGGRYTLLLPSGLAAITLVDASLLKAGDEVLLPHNVYNPSRELARHELAQWGIAHRFYDPMDAAALDAAIGPSTRLVWIEPPGSVTMEFPDVPALAGIARAKGAIVALDNTWGAGLAFQPFELGVDISMHALTKFPSGGGDVLMGAVTTCDEALHLRLKMTHMRMGWGVAANDAETVLRSLPSMAVRYEAQDRSARALAAWWATRPEAARVLHPALESSPGHANWQRLCRGAGCLLSVVFHERITTAQADAFVDALQLFKIGYSWAGPMSLAVPYDVATMRPQAGIRGPLVRFSVGLEAVEDLVADCEQALAVTFSR